MSRFNTYAKKMDRIARAAFEEYERAAERQKRAEERKWKYPQRQGMVTADYAVSSARAQADYLEAVKGREDVRRKMDEGEYRQQIKSLRKELAAAVDEAFRVDPEQIDNATLELLKSGICTPDEYNVLLNKAASTGNVTMARLIGKYAEDAADAALAAAGGHMNDPTASALRAVTYQARNYNGKQWLDAFDYMTDVYNRAIKNPGMINSWDGLTADAVEKF